jgi:hypothetical protein
MRAGLDPFSFLVISVAGWLNQRQQQVIEYLIEEKSRSAGTNRQPPKMVSTGRLIRD